MNTKTVIVQWWLDVHILIYTVELIVEYNDGV